MTETTPTISDQPFLKWSAEFKFYIYTVCFSCSPPVFYAAFGIKNNLQFLREKMLCFHDLFKTYSYILLRYISIM